MKYAQTCLNALMVFSIDELIRETLALKYLATNEITTLNKKVIYSRSELISIFSTVNDLLREEVF
ncbi:MAG: hypothetical protein JSC189_000682 [Candidatus Tokpelaia sp. JSC189]|nr:MAG: hypothetical protein JSC189_000682 [Candidatus Tokpelaia sp. JSC189]